MTKMDNGNVKIICITPVRNEEWILEKFLKCVSLWADHIIVADQNSTDRSGQIARSFSKVIFVGNPENQYSEINRSFLLWNEVRKIEGEKLVIALDADEFLTSNFCNSAEWKTMINAERGTLFILDRLEIAPGIKKYFGKIKMAIGFRDDDISDMSQTAMANIHNMRVPWPKNSNLVVYLEDIKSLHYSIVDYERFKSRNRWYQCFERIYNKVDSITLFRRYFLPDNSDQYLKKYQLQPFDMEYFSYYHNHGIDLANITNEKEYWWDRELIDFIRLHSGKLKYFNIWSIDWSGKAKKYDLLQDNKKLNLRRNIFVKIVSSYLLWSQARTHKRYIKFIDRILSRFID